LSNGKIEERRLFSHSVDPAMGFVCFAEFGEKGFAEKVGTVRSRSRADTKNSLFILAMSLPNPYFLIIILFYLRN
jgi:hypothetical protein